MSVSDGRYFVVKFRNNPQGSRTLANELVSSALLRYLGLPAAGVGLVLVDEECLSRNPGLHIELSHGWEPVSAGYHFGSLYPVDPNVAAVYDLLPTKILDQVANRQAFVGMLVADKWLGNADSRQAVFFRGSIRDDLSDSSAHPRRRALLARMIDHGHTFNGRHWTFEDTPAFGLYHDNAVYCDVHSRADFQPWFEKIGSVGERVIKAAVGLVPEEWEVDVRPLEVLLGRLREREKQLPRMIEALRASVYTPFEQWFVAAGAHGM